MYVCKVTQFENGSGKRGSFRLLRYNMLIWWMNEWMNGWLILPSESTWKDGGKQEAPLWSRWSCKRPATLTTTHHTNTSDGASGQSDGKTPCSDLNAIPQLCLWLTLIDETAVSATPRHTEFSPPLLSHLQVRDNLKKEEKKKSAMWRFTTLPGRFTQRAAATRIGEF